MSATTHVINPLTGRQIKVGGAMYKKLVREGVIVNQPYELVQSGASGGAEEKEVAQATKKKDSASHAQRASARERKKQEVLRKRQILREKKKLQKELQREKKKKEKMLRKQEEKLKRQREAFEQKQRIARESDFRRQMKLQAKENEKRLRQELNKQAKKKASGVFSKLLLEHLEELIESENLEGTIESLLESKFDLSEPEVATMKNVLVEKTEELALRAPEGLKEEIHPFGERSKGGEGVEEEVDELTPSDEELTSSEEEDEEEEEESESEVEEDDEVEEEVEEEVQPSARETQEGDDDEVEDANFL